MVVRVELDDEIRDRLERRVEESDFETIEEYVEFVLTEVTAPTPEIEGLDVDSDREDAVRNNLRSLGYIE